MSCNTNWTEDDLKELESAIAKGAKRVKYKDKEIEYMSLREMLSLRDTMRRALKIRPNTKRCQISVKKGLC